MDISVGQQREMEVTIRLLFQDSPTEHLPYALRPHMKAKGAVTWFFGRGEEGHELIVGLGERARFDLEALRDAAGNAGRAAEKERVTEACVTFDSLEPLFAAGLDRHSAVTAWTEGWLLGTYVFVGICQRRKNGVSLCCISLVRVQKRRSRRSNGPVSVQRVHALHAIS